MKSLVGAMAANRLRADAGDRRPAETDGCRVPGCGGSLRFEVNRLGVVMDICERCEDRARQAAPLTALILQRDRELAVARHEIGRLRRRETVLAARTASLEEQLRQLSRMAERPPRRGVDGVGTAGRVMVVLRTAPQPLTCPEISAQIEGVRRSAVQQMLSWLTRRGRILRVARGRYKAAA